MNAVVFASGYASGGNDGAAEALAGFWNDIARTSVGFSMHFTPFDAVFHFASPQYKFYDVVSRFVSPYQANPFNINPLRETLARHVDFDRGLIGRLHDIGFKAADEWLRRNFRYLGKRSTLDVLEESEHGASA